MGTYNNPGMLRSLFSLPPSLPYKFHKSIFPYRGRNSMNWKSRFNFNIRAKECKFRPVVERVEGNSRVGFSGKGRGKTFVPIFRSFNDRKRSLRSFVTPPMNIQRWLEGLNFPNERKVCPEDSYGKSCFDNVFAGIHVTLFDRRLETKRAALWKDISMILHESSMFYKSRCVFALWRLESANWCRYYLSRWCWS